jgi:hypothetical protein
VATARPSGAFSWALSDAPPGDGLVVDDESGAPLLTGGVVPDCVLAC